jgi:hypothetical protein
MSRNRFEVINRIDAGCPSTIHPSGEEIACYLGMGPPMVAKSSRVEYLQLGCGLDHPALSERCWSLRVGLIAELQTSPTVWPR